MPSGEQQATPTRVDLAVALHTFNNACHAMIDRRYDEAAELFTQASLLGNDDSADMLASLTGQANEVVLAACVKKLIKVDRAPQSMLIIRARGLERERLYADAMPLWHALMMDGNPAGNALADLTGLVPEEQLRPLVSQVIESGNATADFFTMRADNLEDSGFSFEAEQLRLLAAEMGLQDSDTVDLDTVDLGQILDIVDNDDLPTPPQLAHSARRRVRMTSTATSRLPDFHGQPYDMSADPARALFATMMHFAKANDQNWRLI
jgi:hypothetical protein